MGIFLFPHKFTQIFLTATPSSGCMHHRLWWAFVFFWISTIINRFYVCVNTHTHTPLLVCCHCSLGWILRGKIAGSKGFWYIWTFPLSIELFPVTGHLVCVQDFVFALFYFALTKRAVFILYLFLGLYTHYISDSCGIHHHRVTWLTWVTLPLGLPCCLASRFKWRTELHLWSRHCPAISLPLRRLCGRCL